MGQTGEPGAEAKHANMGTAMDEIARLERALKDIAAWSTQADGARGVARAVLKEPSTERDGMARLQHDVVTLPADQQALGLVEAILEAADASTFSNEQWVSPPELRIRLAIIQGDAERLKVLIEKQPALLPALKRCKALLTTVGVGTQLNECDIRSFQEAAAAAQAAIEAAS